MSYPRNSGIDRRKLADEIDALDAQIKTLNDSKSETYKDFREKLEGQGMEPRRASAEVAATKAAIARRRKLKADPAAVREKDDLIDEILSEIMRPSRAREDGHEVPPADDSTRSSGDRGSASSVPSDGAAATHSEAAAASAGDEPATIAASPAPIHPPLETAGLPVAAAAGDVPRNSRGLRYPEGCMEPECCHSSSWRQRCTSCDRAHGEIERANFAAAELDRPLADRLTS
jgi:hypothetical protein